jgi:hypothetical protein
VPDVLSVQMARRAKRVTIKVAMARGRHGL